ncbi:MAG: DUF1272 domain-containing protein [Bdellovibrionota bacterium]
MCTLELILNCECCNCELAPGSTVAVICSFERTFCTMCAEEKLNFSCPNCAGELIVLPRCSLEMLLNTPASSTRIFKSQRYEAKIQM